MRALLIMYLLICCSLAGYSQVYQAEYTYRFNTVDAFINDVGSTNSDFQLPVDVVFKYKVLTNGKQMIVTGEVVETEGDRVLFRQYGATKAFIDLETNQVVLEEGDGSFSEPQALGTLNTGASLSSAACPSKFYISEYDTAYTVSFCDTIPKMIHLILPFEDPPGGVTHVRSSSVAIQLLGYRKIQESNFSFPFKWKKPKAMDGVFYFLR